MNYIEALLKNKCPRCRKGNIFLSPSAYKKGFMKMPEKCSVCGQPTEKEPGFYFGSAYASYALTVALSVSTFIAWWVLIGFSLNDNRLFWWLGFNAFFLIVLQPWIMRLSRTMWLSFFVSYNSKWDKEQTNETENGINSKTNGYLKI